MSYKITFLRHVSTPSCNWRNPSEGPLSQVTIQQPHSRKPIWISVTYYNVQMFPQLFLYTCYGTLAHKELFRELIHPKHDRHLRHDSQIVDWQASIESPFDTILRVDCHQCSEAATNERKQGKKESILLYKRAVNYKDFSHCKRTISSRVKIHMISSLYQCHHHHHHMCYHTGPF